VTKEVEPETFSSKAIAGAPGRTLLELFLKKVWIFQSTRFRYESWLEHDNPEVQQVSA
jgi:hypothetical protein